MVIAEVKTYQETRQEIQEKKTCYLLRKNKSKAYHFFLIFSILTNPFSIGNLESLEIFLSIDFLLVSFFFSVWSVNLYFFKQFSHQSCHFN